MAHIAFNYKQKMAYLSHWSCHHTGGVNYSCFSTEQGGKTSMYLLLRPQGSAPDISISDCQHLSPNTCSKKRENKREKDNKIRNKGVIVQDAAIVIELMVHEQQQDKETV